jgi:hypothetical protein
MRRSAPRMGHCLADVSVEDLDKVRSILPWACIAYGVTWRAEVKDEEGDACPKWTSEEISDGLA